MPRRLSPCGDSRRQGCATGPLTQLQYNQHYHNQIRNTSLNIYMAKHCLVARLIGMGAVVREHMASCNIVHGYIFIVCNPIPMCTGVRWCVPSCLSTTRFSRRQLEWTPIKRRHYWVMVEGHVAVCDSFVPSDNPRRRPWSSCFWPSCSTSC